MMKILVTDGMSKMAVNELKNLGHDVEEKFYDDESLGSKLKEVNAVVVRSATKVREKHINEALSGGNLKLIIRGGVGIDNIDYEYAKEKGISVRNTPSASAPSVAELAIAHMFALARFLPDAKTTMCEGLWEKKCYKGIELNGKTLGIVGMGRIGYELAKRGNALGMNVIYYDICDLKNEFKKVSLDELYKNSDFISFHIPAQKNGKAVVDSDSFSKMKDGVFIINCARGGVIDEEALLSALKQGKVAGAGIDVYVDEPTHNINLVKHPRVSVTPHIGAQTKEAQERVGKEVVNIIKSL
jgi:D-3-phosphoglycerate dehydrogenase / 2-oxoglutarate reductase